MTPVKRKKIRTKKGKVIVKDGDRVVSISRYGSASNFARHGVKTIAKIKRMLASGKHTQQSIAWACDVHQSTVSRVKNQLSRKEVK